MALPITETHKSWCVRPRHTGACSEKRGHWDRSTNTWQSDLTDDARRMIKQALVRYRRNGEPRESVIAWVKEHPGFEHCTVDSLQTWYMTYRKFRAKGKKWPI